MRSAIECAPKTCSCGKRLPKPSYDYIWKDSYFTYMQAFNSPEWAQEKLWHIKCNECSLIYVWSWHDKANGCWKIRSANPLFDSQEIVVIA